MVEGSTRPSREFRTRIGVFVGTYLVLELLVLGIGYAGGMGWLMWSTARATYMLSRMTGVVCMLDGQRLVLQDQVLLISLDCTGVFVIAAFAALVAAYPTGARARAEALSFGIPALLVLNIARLVAVTNVADRMPSAFAFTHDYLFEVGMIAASAALWLVWMRGVRAREA